MEGEFLEGFWGGVLEVGEGGVSEGEFKDFGVFGEFEVDGLGVSERGVGYGVVGGVGVVVGWEMVVHWEEMEINLFEILEQLIEGSMESGGEEGGKELGGIYRWRIDQMFGRIEIRGLDIFKTT